MNEKKKNPIKDFNFEISHRPNNKTRNVIVALAYAVGSAWIGFGLLLHPSRQLSTVRNEEATMSTHRRSTRGGQ